MPNEQVCSSEERKGSSEDAVHNELHNLLSMAESEVEDGKHEPFVTCKIDAGLRTLKDALNLIENNSSLKQE